MPGFNKVILMRTLTRGPEVRHIPSGASVCRFALALNRSYTTQAGHRRNETCFLAVNVWGAASGALWPIPQERPRRSCRRAPPDSEAADSRRAEAVRS